MASLAEIKRSFLSATRFAVVGASKDQSKFGTRVLKWYQARAFDVTPVHPKEGELEGVKTVNALSELPGPFDETSVSIITPPKVTLGILESAKELGIRALWLQPGAEDEAVIDYVNSSGLSDRVILGGPCVLVEGDDVIRELVKL